MPKLLYILTATLLLAACSKSNDIKAIDLESRIQTLEQENLRLHEQLETKQSKTLYNDGAVKLKCQELREEAQYQDDDIRTFDIYYSPVLNTCVVELMTITTGEIWFSLFDALGARGSRTLIQSDTVCKDSEDFKCTTMEQYNIEKKRLIP